MSQRSRPSFRRVLFVALLASLLPVSHAAAQVTGSIAGAVRDVSGAVLPGAAVTVRGAALQRESATATIAATTRPFGMRMAADPMPDFIGRRGPPG